ncbi:MAG: hypothetical protein HZC02_03230 [Candidatus Levybacteria bacterium]|nr:hypothetical protein [Candidatus Levybacteria bacterium]
MKPQQQKNLLYILIPSAFVILVWIILGIYSKAVNSTLTKPQSLLITPISSTFDASVIDDLKKRDAILADFSLGNQSEQDTPDASPTSELVPDLEPTASDSAVEGAI